VAVKPLKLAVPLRQPAQTDVAFTHQIYKDR
jgi:hypothetical protein